MELFYATQNEYKIENMKKRLLSLPISIMTPKDKHLFIEVEEDGITVIENAKKKAFSYYPFCHLPTLAADSALYVEKFDEQPGLHVRRKQGNYLSDEEIEQEYIQRLKKVGGSSLAYYVTGLVFLDEDYQAEIEIIEEPFLLTADRYPGKRGKDALGRLEKEIATGRYFCETRHNKQEGKFDKECRQFIQMCLDRML